ncbi:hypothetical protein ABB02_00442 [Clostridiaceae bacterium JG1575]|nr:hypothetical protein ABB02_00442 [Clostridiaceae bacterium JG1575]
MGSLKLRTIRDRHLRTARALDVFRWMYHFEEGSAQMVLKALKAYQNSDGGFGHGLEPDLGGASSSPIASAVAARLLVELGLPPLAQSMVRPLQHYLEKTQSAQGTWPVFGPVRPQGLHAPWWDVDEKALFWGWNPSAELAAFYLRTKGFDEGTCARCEAALQRALEDLLTPTHDLTAHECVSLAQALETLEKTPWAFSPEAVTALAKRIRAHLPDSFTHDDTQEYLPHLNWFLNGRENPLYPELREAAEAYGPYLESTVTKDGVWLPNWQWGDAKIPPSVLRDWQGVLTLENMRYLQGFRPDPILKNQLDS